MPATVMPGDQQDLLVLSSYLERTLHADANTRRMSEQQLAAAESQPNFPLTLLKIVESPAIPDPIRRSSATYFKNFIRHNWKQTEGEIDKIRLEDRKAIKAHIVDIMISVPSNLQVQLSEAVTIIADSDFPEKWEDLIDILITKLNAQDYNINNGVLQTAHSIFKRWRHQFRSDKLFMEINMVLQKFSQPFLELFKHTDALVESNASNPDVLKILFNSILLLTKIFFSLNCQDLPEFFEDHQDAFMEVFHKYLLYENPLLNTDDEEEGPMERVKASICEIIDLYAKRYEEEFTKLPKFVETIWTLLTTTGPQPKYDVLVSKAIYFLTSVIKPARHRDMFKNKETLQNICEKIVLPNMALREQDEELFEDNPIEYIRRDLEGLDADTRRRAASDLVRGLLEHFSKEVTEIFSEYVNMYLDNYNKDPTKNWKSKDTALYLITSLSAKSVTIQGGATKTNEYVQILQVFTTHVLPELQSPVNGLVHPIIKVDAIKYLLIFRSQLLKQQLLEVLPTLTIHLTSSNYVVYTYAAVCIERILGMKDKQTQMFHQNDVAEVAFGLCQKLFELIWKGGAQPHKLAENDFLMKAIMRVILVTRNALLPHVNYLLSEFNRILGIICKNPSNPKFNHLVFESVAALVRFICAANPSLVGEFEKVLGPVFEEVLRLDVAEFKPYIYQILSQLLDLHRDKKIPPTYQAMLPGLLLPSLWESHGSIPALVRLISSFLAKDPASIIANNQLPQYLGVFQKLNSSRITDQHGFDLLEAIFHYVPPEAIHPYMKNIFVLLLNRLMGSKTAKFSKGFLNFVCFLLNGEAHMDPQTIVDAFESVQPNLWSNLLQSVLIPELQEVVSPEERKTNGLAFTRLLTMSSLMITDPYLQHWAPILTALVAMFEAPIAETGHSPLDDDEAYALDIEEAGYQAVYAKLVTVGKSKLTSTTITEGIDSRLMLGQAIIELNRKYPQKISTIVQQLSPDVSASLQSYCQLAGGSLMR